MRRNGWTYEMDADERALAHERDRTDRDDR